MMEGKKGGWRDEKISSTVVASPDLNCSKPCEWGGRGSGDCIMV